MNALINTLKAKQEDFEFYPTTDEILQAIKKHFKDTSCVHILSHHAKSVLDIGAGDGRVLRFFRDQIGLKCFAIEKSQELCTRLIDDFFVVGTDFREQNLLMKEYDVTFCNPPYSEFAWWAEQIIRNSCSPLIYLVIPERWKESRAIQEAIKYRDAKVEVIGTFTFLEADRKARGKVNVLAVLNHDDHDDAFARFFEHEFKELTQKFNELPPDEEEKKDPRFTQLISAPDYIQALLNLYHDDVSKIQQNYALIRKLDADLLREFQVIPKKICELLKNRLNETRQLYWRTLFDRLSTITNRLIRKRREAFLSELNNCGGVDFTIDNIRIILIWILKNASHHLEGQVIDVYDYMLSKANCRNYSSNHKVYEYKHGFRYEQDRPTHIYLDYRIILEWMGGIDRSWDETRLSENACQFIRDLLTIANHLGMTCDTQPSLLHYGTQWTPGSSYEFFSNDGRVLFEVKAFLNHNLHIRFNQDFMLALNVTYGRIKRWLMNAEEASSELGNVNASIFFNMYKTLPSQVSLLLPEGFSMKGAA